jgi:uncharacterized protein YndB with AHSA1/START domain
MEETMKVKVTTPSDREIHMEREFDAPRELVWRAHTEPELVKKWWGRGNKLVIEKLEQERGGHWRFVEETPEGKHGFEGRFREVTRPSRIVQSFEWDGMPAHVCINFAEFAELPDGRTRVSTTSLFHTQEERDGMLQSGMETGLEQSYQALEKLLKA